MYATVRAVSRHSIVGTRRSEQVLSNLLDVWEGHHNGGAGNGGHGVGGETKKKSLDDVVLNFKLC